MKKRNQLNVGNVLVKKQVAIGSVRSKNQIDGSTRTCCVVLKQFWKPERTFSSSLELQSWKRLHTNNCFGRETGGRGSV